MRRAQAFTLVELMLVMTMLVIVLAVAAPTLGNYFRGRTLDSEARRLLALTRHGQNRAASEGVPMVLSFDAKARTYRLEAEAGYLDRDERMVEFTLNQDLAIEVVRSDISVNVKASPLSLARRDLPDIRFLPDGSVDETSVTAVRLLDRDGTAAWLMQTRNRLSYEIRNPTNQWDTITP